jgi:hypothetical protein
MEKLQNVLPDFDRANAQYLFGRRQGGYGAINLTQIFGRFKLVCKPHHLYIRRGSLVTSKYKAGRWFLNADLGKYSNVMFD